MAHKGSGKRVARPKAARNTRLVHHRHTGKLVHHRHTAFGPLRLVLVVIASGFGFSQYRTTKDKDVLAANIELSGVVAAPPPTQKASITSPASGQRYKSRTALISGQCDTNLIIDIFSNGIFAGSTVCSENRFRLNVSLFPGENILTVKMVDALGQSGPPSEEVLTYFDQPSELRSPGVDDLFLRVPTAYTSVSPNQTFKVEPEIVGGQGPYALNIDWEDGEGFYAEIQSQGKVLATHVYRNPGIYRTLYIAADSHGRNYRISTVVVVNGEVTGGSSVDGAGGANEIAASLANVSVPVWATLAFSTTIVGSFWVGQHLSYARFVKQTRIPRAH